MTKQVKNSKTLFRIDDNIKISELSEVVFTSSDYLGHEFIARVGESSYLMYVRVIKKQEALGIKFENQLVVDPLQKNEKKIWKQLSSYAFVGSDFSPLAKCHIGNTKVVMAYKYVWGTSLSRAIKKLGISFLTQDI